MHLGLIGYGNIARTLLGVLASEGTKLSQVSVLCHSGKSAETARSLSTMLEGKKHVVQTADALVATRPDLVVECAGHDGVREHAPAVLRAGIETVIVSVGALADEVLYAAIKDSARAGGTRFILPAGAIGGIDILSALKASGIEAVTYTGRKPPQAWKGTYAQTLHDLDTLDRETVFFTGTAREAATQYPKNANVAATLALAGRGFDGTQVRLIADPKVEGNVHEYSVTANGADFSIKIEGRPSKNNPKTSVTTVYSVAREIFNRSREQAV
ncbi:aspartate dehydrogenase [Pelagibacterium lentulum]|uniref:L-aspartate dehydrogenase n=1 Tax=Pelagibacterium lentulum TaxID=2029865 RepID=A0A916RB02_9HYPH|nr:aspartate dehydrogenase [Pelagibacterium lentulum]GGA43137.1 putative L-aspartate dehydrogenase [Pelagibacterium lentulum]